jgi:hypothetical protein
MVMLKCLLPLTVGTAPCTLLGLYGHSYICFTCPQGPPGLSPTSLHTLPLRALHCRVTSLSWFAEEARRACGDVLPAPDGRRRFLAVRAPLGVVAALTPWNFPLSMITRKLAPALAAGCTVSVQAKHDGCGWVGAGG